MFKEARLLEKGEQGNIFMFCTSCNHAMISFSDINWPNISVIFFRLEVSNVLQHFFHPILTHHNRNCLYGHACCA